MNLSKARIFLFCCLAFIIGIAIASFLPSQWVKNDICWFAGMVGWAVVLFLFWPHYKIRIIALVGMFLFLGFWQYTIRLPASTLDKIWYYNGQTVTMTGVVSNEPDIRQKNVKLEVRIKKLEGVDKDIEGKILVTTDLYPVYNYGDELEITGELQAPEQFQGFAYDRYLARYDIYSVCYYPKIVPLPSASPFSKGRNMTISFSFAEEGLGGVKNWLYAKIFQLKNKLREIISCGLSEPSASLGRAIILGDKKGIPENLRANFSQAGLSHIVAISGMHISILAALVMAMLLGLGLARRYAFYLASLFLIAYIVLIGVPASAMRAGLMGFLVLWALNLGRLSKLTNSLVLAASILLLFNPRLLRDDVGFQLSFLAVLGIVHVYPLLDQWFDKIKNPKFKGIRDIFIITIAAQAFTLPIIAYNFSQVSLIAPLSNLLVLWTLPLLMIAVLVAIILSFLYPPLAVVFFLPAWLLLTYIIKAAELAVTIPYSYLEISYIWFGWLWLYYILLVWVIVKMKKRLQPKTG